MESLLFWGLALMAAGVALLLVDLFVPSGGILSIVAGLCAIAGVVVLFRHDTTWGMSGLLALMVLGPMIVVFMIKVWPSTPVGRAVIGAPTEEQVQKQQEAEEAERRKWLALVGKEGVVLTDLRPIGTVEVDGRRFDALSETSFVRAGQRVRVTVAEPSQMKVRPLA